MMYDIVDPLVVKAIAGRITGLPVQVWAWMKSEKLIPNGVVTPWFHLHDDYGLLDIDLAEVVNARASPDADVLGKLREWIEQHHTL